MKSEREGMRNAGDFLRFEELMEYLSQSMDPELHVLDEYANCQAPNFNHHFLARMILQGHEVLTTNFDSLIEIALLETGDQPGQINPVIFQRDWEADQTGERHNVYKLHGSLMDMRTRSSCRGSIQATLEQINQGKNNLLQLEPWKRQVLKRFLENDDLVVMGYSGLDDFDLLPTLLNISSDKNIIWINHAGENSLANAEIKTLKGFEREKDEPDRVWRVLSRFSQSESRLPEHIVRINLDTRQFVEWMWDHFLKTPRLEIQYEAVKRESRGPALTLSPINQWILAGKIYHDRNMLSESLSAYQTALALAKAKGDREKMGICFAGVGHLLHKLGRKDEAHKYDLQGLKVARSCKDLVTMAILLNEIGSDELNQHRFHEAEKAYQEALKVARQQADRRWEARTLNNWGILEADRGNFKKAKELYDEAVAINDHIGDLRAKTTNYNNLGTLSSAQNNNEEAVSRYRQVIDLADRLGDLMKKAKGLNAIGQILEEEGRITEAQDHYVQALELSEKNEMPHVKMACLFSLAELHYKRREMDEALEYCERLLEIPDQLEDTPEKIALAKASLLARMGVIYHYKQRLAESLQAFEEALALYDQYDQPAGKCPTLSNFAFLLDDMGQKGKATHMLAEARVLARRLGDPFLLNYVMDMQRRIVIGD